MVVRDESDSPVTYFEELRTLARSDPLKERVIFTGYQERVAEYYGACDMVVHCSVEPEPVGRVVIEGMACKRATIAMAEGGPADIITHGQDGLLVPPRDPTALASAVLHLYEDAGLREQLGRNALRTVEERFSPRAIAAEVIKCYR